MLKKLTGLWAGLDVIGDFLDFIGSQRYELETGWFLLDRTVYPEFEPAEATLLMDKLSDRVRELITPPLGPRQTCSIINRVLFHEHGFRGAGKNFEDPENSFLHRVLERKQGLPITLSVLYLLIARRIGFELEPIGLLKRTLYGWMLQRRPTILCGCLVRREDFGTRAKWKIFSNIPLSKILDQLFCRL